MQTGDKKTDQSVSTQDKEPNTANDTEPKSNDGNSVTRVGADNECLLPTTGHTPSMITFNCELCNVQCSSEEVFETHLKGQKHQKKVKRKQELEQSGMAEQVQNSDTYCKVCSVELTSKAHMPLHLAGKRHRQNLMKALSSSAPDTDIAKSVEEFDKKQKEEEQVLIDRAGIKDFSKYAIPAEKKQQALAEGAKNEFYCKLCNKFFTGRTQLAMHIMSTRHKEKENPTVRPKRPIMRGTRRFFEIDSDFGRMPRPAYDSNSQSNFYQNSMSDLSADFSLPSPKIPRMDRNQPATEYRRPRSEFLVSPEREHYTGYSRMPMPPPKSFYSTYQSLRAANWRSSRSVPSRNWQEDRISGDYWGSPRAAEPYWQGGPRDELYDDPLFDRRLDDMGPGGRPPHWYSGMQPPAPRENYYEDYSPVDFDNNFSYRGSL